jgi:hypothetical protein
MSLPAFASYYDTTILKVKHEHCPIQACLK